MHNKLIHIKQFLTVEKKIFVCAMKHGWRELEMLKIKLVGLQQLNTKQKRGALFTD